MLLAPTLAVIAASMFGQAKRKEYYNKLHITLNSRLTQLVRASKLQAFAEGKIKGASDFHANRKTEQVRAPRKPK